MIETAVMCIRFSFFLQNSVYFNPGEDVEAGGKQLNRGNRFGFSRKRRYMDKRRRWRSRGAAFCFAYPRKVNIYPITIFGYDNQYE